MDLWECEQVCTAKMNLSEEVDLEDYVSRPDKISAAEVRFSTCRTPVSVEKLCFIGWASILSAISFN